MKLVLLLTFLAVAHGACPNGCNGHGACDSNGRCTCYLEGKALNQAAADLSGTPVRWKVATATITGPVAVTLAGASVSVNTADTTDFVLTDGGIGYLVGMKTPPTCAVGDTLAVQTANECPNISVVQTAANAVSAGTDMYNAQCTSTIADGKITKIQCVSLASASKHAYEDVVTTVVIAPPIKYDGAGVMRYATPPKAQWTGADCSLKTCPRGMSWINTVPATTSEVFTYKHVNDAECSDGGTCDRGSGTCQCNPGFEGSACQRTTCHESCNGHGICQSNVKFAEQAGARYIGAWDSGKQFGCKCDSGFRGGACELQECPSSSDPLGFQGNGQGRDCSGRGLCDYNSGTCNCFEGYSGGACEQVQALA